MYKKTLFEKKKNKKTVKTLRKQNNV